MFWSLILVVVLAGAFCHPSFLAASLSTSNVRPRLLGVFFLKAIRGVLKACFYVRAAQATRHLFNPTIRPLPWSSADGPWVCALKVVGFHSVSQDITIWIRWAYFGPQTLRHQSHTAHGFNSPGFLIVMIFRSTNPLVRLSHASSEPPGPPRLVTLLRLTMFVPIYYGHAA